MTGSEKENVPLIMLNNFHRDKHCLNIKLKCLKRNSVKKLMKNSKMTAINDVIRQKREMLQGSSFF